MVIKPTGRSDYNASLMKMMQALNEAKRQEHRESEIMELKKVNTARIEQLKKEVKDNSQVKRLKAKQKEYEDGNRKLDKEIEKCRELKESLRDEASEISMLLSSEARQLGKLEVVIYPIESWDGK